MPSDDGVRGKDRTGVPRTNSIFEKKSKSRGRKIKENGKKSQENRNFQEKGIRCDESGMFSDPRWDGIICLRMQRGERGKENVHVDRCPVGRKQRDTRKLTRKIRI